MVIYARKTNKKTGEEIEKMEQGQGRVVITKEWCPNCDEMIKFHGKEVNHVLHGILTVFTGGLWGIIWYDKTKKARAICTKCGYKL